MRPLKSRPLSSLIGILLGTTSAHAMAATADAPSPMFLPMQQSVQPTAKFIEGRKIQPMPVSTEMRATRRSDGTIELSCGDVRQHAEHEHNDMARPL